MGDYNPHAPLVLGQEWVPIFDEPSLAPVPTGNLFEQGHSFVLPAPRVASQGRFYLRTQPPGSMTGMAYQVSLYPRGQEGLSGPIRRVVIPCSSAGVTGASLVGATTGANALLNPGDGSYVQFSDPSGQVDQRVVCTFAMAQYLPELAGKRILGVNVLYTAGGSMAEIFAKWTVNTALDVVGGGQRSYGIIEGEENFVPNLNNTVVHRKALGELNTMDSGLVDINPWVTTSLSQLNPGTAVRQFSFWFRGLSPSVNVSTFNFIALNYCALEVIYCEETRLAYGQSFYSATFTPPNVGTNTVIMKTVGSLAVNPVIPAGTYSIVVSAPDMGDMVLTNYSPVQDSAYGTLRAPRQLYQLPSHQGVLNTLPFPPYAHLGETFATTTVDVLPQLSMHATGNATWPEVHAYGEQVAAPVYGAVTATQGVEGSNGPASASYPQVRFWARRFGATTVALQVASGSSSASITPAAFDGLPEVMAGWREIDLRFAVPPTMGTGVGLTTWTFSAAGELPGSRWEVLGARAYAISGTPGNLLNQMPDGALTAATYLQPAGGTARLTWLAPQVSGAASDPFSDAALYFSQDPPTVTGLAVSQLSMAVTGVNLNCTSPPDSVPTGIGYQRVTWTAPAATGSGFGYLELQRMDTIGTTWQTIMKTVSPAVTGFNDYESRVGVQSSYQVRLANAMGFLGSWSVTGTGTLTAPGVTGRRVDNSVLVLTSNFAQSGFWNMAYMETWDGTAVEDLGFPEAGRNKLSWMYGKDYQSAFRPTERGGEQFTRVLLVQDAPGTVGRLHNAFRKLRDAAWTQLPYVCVRNELGDRWYMNVVVPTGSLRKNRTIQLVQAQFTEITGTPYPVDPSL